MPKESNDLRGDTIGVLISLTSLKMKSLLLLIFLLAVIPCVRAQQVDLIEYDFDTSESLKVPGDWNTQEERLLLYEGTIWYKKSFDYQRKENTRLFVYFGAANYLADVYLNGQKIGRHEGGFTPFNFE